MKETLAGEDIISQLNEPWQRKERLRFIDAHLFWTGVLRRDDLCSQFELHYTNASKDIKLYMELAPNNLVYDNKKKTYRSTPVFSSISGQHVAGNLLAYTQLNMTWHGFVPDYLVAVPLPLRRPSSATLRNILTCANDGSGIEVLYHSMRNPEGLTRVIYPQTIIFDGLRWHTRAFDMHTESYRDFVLSRIKSTGNTTMTKELPVDEKWQQTVELVVKPHPDLSLPQQKMIELDYAMEDGCIRINTRKPLAPYIIRILNLDTDLKPPRQQLVCENKELWCDEPFNI